LAGAVVDVYTHAEHRAGIEVRLVAAAVAEDIEFGAVPPAGEVQDAIRRARLKRRRAGCGARLPNKIASRTQ